MSETQKIRRRRTSKPDKEVKSAADDKEILSEASNILKSKGTQRNVRFIGDEIPNLKKVRSYVKLEKDKFISLRIVREKKTKLNGVRQYFKCYDNGSLMFSSKAKTSGSREIPISYGSEVHLSTGSKDALLLNTENNTRFVLKNIKQDKIELVVHFELPRKDLDGTKRTRVSFYGSESLAFDLISSVVTDTPTFGGKYRTFSVKNSNLVNEENGDMLVVIRKVDKGILEIDSLLQLSQIQLFALGISSFLGKVPK